MSNITISELRPVELEYEVNSLSKEELSDISNLSDENCQEIIGGTTWRTIRNGKTTVQSNDVNDGVTITLNYDNRTIKRLQRTIN